MELQISAFNRKEVLQYLGWRGTEITEDVEMAINKAIETTMNKIHPRYIWKEFEVDKSTWTLSGTDFELKGENIKELLSSSNSVILLAATLGPEMDREITKAEPRSLTDAIILDCCGSSAIESVCDEATKTILKSLPNDVYLTDRFSPGYGDFPLESQEGLIKILDTSRRIGLTLTESLIMVPRKSVTAVIGVSKEPQTKRFRGCAYCNMFENCTYRKAGGYCGKT